MRIQKIWMLFKFSIRIKCHVDWGSGIHACWDPRVNNVLKTEQDACLYGRNRGCVFFPVLLFVQMSALPWC
jgi:hypothetical protein